MSFFSSSCSLLLVFMMLIGPAHAGVLYVDIDAAGAGDGSSWTDAYANVQSALDAANDNDELWVATGTYDGLLTVTRDGAALYGGFNGTETSRDQRDAWNNETILTSSTNGSIISILNKTGVTVDGFVILGGVNEQRAGGVHVENGTADLSACILFGNMGAMGGGALAYNATLSLSNSIFSNNFGGLGGGLALFAANATVDSCLFETNDAMEGAGIFSYFSNSTFSNCTAVNNYASLGGGMHMEISTSELTGCSISSNFAENAGGGVFSSFSVLDMDSCEIMGNLGWQGGGVFSEPTLESSMSNSVISGNYAGIGGGIVMFGAPWDMVNDTFADNQAEEEGGQIVDISSNATMRDCIFTGGRSLTNATDGIYIQNSSPIFDSCLFHDNDNLHLYNNSTGVGYASAGDIPMCVNCVDADPMYVMDGPDAIAGVWTADPLYDNATYTSTLTSTGAFVGLELSGKYVQPDTTDQMHVYIVENDDDSLTVIEETPWVENGDAFRVVDHHLRDGSPAMGQANATAAPPLDFEGESRDAQPDIGADEYVDTDADNTPDYLDGCPSDANKIEPGACGCGVADTDGDTDGAADCVDNCPSLANADQADADADGVGDLCDNCPSTSNASQTDSDNDGVGDACDGCPNDFFKTSPGACGCGNPDIHSDGDGIADCNDNCPATDNADQADRDTDGVGDVCDGCPDDHDKTALGACGCGVADTDRDGDLTADCLDFCPDDANTATGYAFCFDQDGDGYGDPKSSVIRCVAPDGRISDCTDCNDRVAAWNARCGSFSPIHSLLLKDRPPLQE